ncbi:MAG: lysine exporter LysO family protein [Candidatus Asgardarchaeia archaeon]
MTYRILLPLILGYLSGYFFDLSEYAYILSALDVVLFASLSLMIFLVCFEVSYKGEFKIDEEVGKNIVYLVMATVFGSALGGLFVGFFLGFTPTQSLGISLGMGWYTFSGAFLIKYMDTYVGMVCFLSNLLREIFCMVAYGPFSKKVGAIPSVTMGGATTMDTNLPVIRFFGGDEASIYALMHGIVITLLVPVLLPLILFL